jgi:uncharacterized phage protein (TIGR01671 family)
MREIEFRGKKKSTGEWAQGGIYHFVRNGEEVVDIITYPIDVAVKTFITMLAPPCVEVDRETVGQYTGLKDKNGVKIFEGDILAFELWGNKNHQKVEWSPVDGWIMNERNGLEYWSLYPCCKETTVEVLGNIHDNPELLKEGE